MGSNPNSTAFAARSPVFGHDVYSKHMWPWGETDVRTAASLASQTLSAAGQLTPSVKHVSTRFGRPSSCANPRFHFFQSSEVSVGDNWACVCFSCLPARHLNDRISLFSNKLQRSWMFIFYFPVPAGGSCSVTPAFGFLLSTHALCNSSTLTPSILLFNSISTDRHVSLCHLLLLSLKSASESLH